MGAGRASRESWDGRLPPATDGRSRMLPSPSAMAPLRRRLLVYPDAGHGSLFQYSESFTKQASQFLSMTSDSAVF